jgi:hypothetical protein
MIPDPPATALFVDPGFAKSNATGWAAFGHGALYRGAAIRGSGKGEMIDRFDEIARQIPQSPRDVFAHGAPPIWDLLCVEFPVIYPFTKQKGDPNDIVRLAGLAARIAAIPAREKRFVEPRAWKGTVPIEKFVERIKKPHCGRFNPLELAYLASVKDVKDAFVTAAGLGLVQLGRWGHGLEEKDA